MKDEQINLRTSAQDKELLKKAGEKLGTKEVSKTILQSVKQVAEKIEYKVDREGIRQTEQNINYGLIHLQKFEDAFKNATGEMLTLPELQTILEGVGKLGSQLILQEAIGETVKTKLHDQQCKQNPAYEFPRDQIKTGDLTDLFEIAGKLNFIPEIKMYAIGILWDCYDISEGKVSINQENVEKRTDIYRFTASTPAELQKLKVVMEICQALDNALKDPEIDPTRIFSLVYYDAEAKRFSPTGSYIKYNSTPHF